MKIGYICGIMILTVFFIVGCTQEVQTGRIVTCKHCGKVIENSVSVIKVPTSKAKQYRVIRETAYCDKCGNEQVAYMVKVACKKCRKVYQTYTRYAARRTEPHDQTNSEGYCSDGCRKMAKVDDAIDRVSEKTGDILGRIGRGISDGIRRHTR